MERTGSMTVSAEQFVVLVLSISCGVLGGFLLAHRCVRMMRGGLLYRLCVGLAAVGIALSLSAGFRILLPHTILPDRSLRRALGGRVLPRASRCALAPPSR